MARRDDRRIQRTRKQLRDSMLALILEKGYDDLNIQDITDHANLGRATFYLHYHEKSDLLADLMNQLFSDFLGSNPQLSLNLTNLTDRKYIQRIFEFAESQYDLYRIMAIGNGSLVGSRQLQAVIREGFGRAFEELKETRGAELKLPLPFLENYCAGSLLSLIYWWLDNDLPYTPAEMAQMFLKVNLLANLKAAEGETPLLKVFESPQPEFKPARSPKPVKVSKEKKEAKPSEEAQPLPASAEENPID